MRRVKSNKNKSTELKLIEVFKELVITGWRRNYRVKRHPEFVFCRKRLLSFWVDVSGMDMTVENTRPSDNQKYWQKSESEISSIIWKLPPMFEAQRWTVFTYLGCELKKKSQSTLAAKLNTMVTNEQKPIPVPG